MKTYIIIIGMVFCLACILVGAYYPFKPDQEVKADQEERPDMSTIMWILLKEYPAKFTGDIVPIPNQDGIKVGVSEIEHGQLRIRIILSIMAYMNVSVKNEQGEVMVHSGGEWIHKGKWVDDFYAFALPIVEKHVAKERAVKEAKEKIEKETAQRVLEGYK